LEKYPLSARLEGKTALVTGGARGIGKAIAEILACNSARVIVHYNKSERQAKEMLKSKVEMIVKADLSKKEDIEKMFDKIRSVDILVNNAGTILKLESLEDLSDTNWQNHMDLLVTNPMRCCRKVIDGMKQRQWGRIINISSIAAKTGGGPNAIAYASAKGALNAFTKALAKEVAPWRICVNAIAPGVIMTDLHKKHSSRKYLKTLVEKTPLGRLGEPEDVAWATLFLASDAASFITGATIDINGGLWIG